MFRGACAIGAGIVAFYALVSGAAVVALTFAVIGAFFWSER